MFNVKPFIPWVRQFIDSFPRIAACYRSVRDQITLNAPLPTPWDFKLAGNASMARGTFEPTETKLVRRILKDVDVLVNVGANVGYYCCHALSMGKNMIAFEPIPRNIRYLCHNIKINNWSGAEIYPIALSNSIGIQEMYGSDTGASILKGWADIPESYVQLVPTSTMDVVLGRRLRGKSTLILVDIEGAERWMLEGATEMLTNDPKPLWIVEIMTKEHQPSGREINPNFRATFQLFFEHGYQAYGVDGEMHPITIEDVSLMSKGIIKPTAYSFLFMAAKQSSLLR